MEQPTDLQRIKVGDLVLDADNPRFLHLKHKTGPLTQSEIENEIIINDDDVPLLTKSIQKSGVKDPIWVVKQKGGKFLVVEGNRRTVVLKRLLKDGVAPPPGVRFDEVQAHVMPSVQLDRASVCDRNPRIRLGLENLTKKFCFRVSREELHFITEFRVGDENTDVTDLQDTDLEGPRANREL